MALAQLWPLPSHSEPQKDAGLSRPPGVPSGADPGLLPTPPDPAAQARTPPCPLPPAAPWSLLVPAHVAREAHGLQGSGPPPPTRGSGVADPVLSLRPCTGSLVFSSFPPAFWGGKPVTRCRDHLGPNAGLSMWPEQWGEEEIFRPACLRQTLEGPITHPIMCWTYEG